MTSRIIITDIHGCFNTFMALLAQLPKDVPITIAGDLIDRGPDSRKVIEYVKSNGIDCVLGNHEDMMVKELVFSPHPVKGEDVSINGWHSVWLSNGGNATLNNYNLPGNETDVKALKEHYEWLNTLPVHLLYQDVKDSKGNCLLVTHSTAARVYHSYGVNSREFKNHVLWERNPMPPKIKGIFNIYGHTPQKGGPTIKKHFACVDNGVYLKNQNDYGHLYALQFPEMIIYKQENIE